MIKLTPRSALYWNLIFKHSPNTPLWNNRYILPKRQSSFLGNLVEKGNLVNISLLDRQGDFLNGKTYSSKCNYVCSFRIMKSFQLFRNEGSAYPDSRFQTWGALCGRNSHEMIREMLNMCCRMMTSWKTRNREMLSIISCPTSNKSSNIYLSFQQLLTLFYVHVQLF